MNEAAQVLNQTNHERKVAGYGVHHKKGGSAVSKLGNKPMSWQEIQSKHGPVQTYTEGFTTYEEFKKMPPDLEAEYVNNLCSKYHIRHEEVSRILFELGENDLMSRLKIKGVEKKILKIKRTDVTEDSIANFKNDVNDWRKKSETAKIIDLSEAQRRRDIIENAEFISYDEFSAFTTDEKILYLNSLIDKYGVSLAAIERELFKLPVTNLRHKLDAAGILKQIKHGKSGFNAAKANKDFCDALKNWRGESTLEVTVPEQPKEEAKDIARDILAAIIGENEPMEPMTEKPELPESNISAVYIPVEQETIEVPVTEPLKTVEDVEAFVEQPDIPKATPKPSSEVYFSTRYISEKGLDREQIMNKIYLLASLFENEENLEITLTVATKKEA